MSAGGKAEPLCRVCGDRASGRHYGVASCDGCRGFFKRSVRRGLEYACKEGGRCVVDVARRNQCQACRLRKCLAVHMRKEAVQHERATRSQPRRRPPRPEPPVALLPEDPQQKTLFPGCAEELWLGPSPLDTAQECAAKLLFLAVRWMRGLPGLLQLSPGDRALLIEEAWSDVFVLSAAQFGFPLMHEEAVFPVLRQLKGVVTQLLAQQVDPAEYSCLKALALFRPETAGLRDPLRVSSLQDAAQVSLHEYVLTRRPPPSKVRFGRLLLALAAARRLNPGALEEALFRPVIGAVPVDRLLADMFQAPA